MAHMTVERPAGIESERPRATWWRRTALSSILVLIGCLGGYYMGAFAAGLTQGSVQPKLDAVSGLAIDPRSLDLGELWETPNHTLTLEMRNVSAEERTIVDFSGSCGCLTIEPRKLTIPPSQTAELAVTLDLTHRLPYQVGLAQWPVSVKFNPVFQGDFSSTPGWEIKALVRSRVSLDCTQIPFMDQCTHLGPSVARKVRARAHVPVERLKVSALPNMANVRVEAVHGSPDEYQIVVSPNPRLPVGPFSFDVEVRAVTLDGEVHRCASIEASGEMQPSLGVFPRLILLGEHSLSDQAEADISVRLPAANWKIDQVATDSPNTLVTQTRTGAEVLVKLHLTQRIVQTGDQVAHVRINVRKPDKQTDVLTVEIRYHGTPQPRPWKTPAVPPKHS